MFKRPSYLKPRIVRVVGHAGEPHWGLLVTRRNHGKVGVVVVKLSGLFPPERLVVPTTWVRSADLLHIPPAALDRFVEAGVLSRSERRALRSRAREALKPTTLKVKGINHGVTRKAEGSKVPSNVGGGALAREHWRLAR